MLNTRICSGAFGFVVAICATSATASSVTYDTITFPQGDISFADVVVETIDSIFANGVPTNPDYIDPAAALGAPDHGALGGSAVGDGAFSLGRGGSIILQFTDNALTGSGDMMADLHVFEIGNDVEDTFVSISQDGSSWLEVGKVFGSTSSIDIDPFLVNANIASNTLFTFVRLRDDPNEGQRFNGSLGVVGADIDAVGAISTVSTPAVPLPAGAPLALTGLAAFLALRRRRG